MNLDSFTLMRLQPYYIILILSLFLATAIQAKDAKKIWLDIQSGNFKHVELANKFIDYGYALRQQNKDTAIAYIKKGLNLADINSGYPTMFKAYNLIGILHKNTGDFQTALKYYYFALEISQRTKDQEGISKAYNNIGVVHQKQLNYDKALEFFEKSLRIKVAIGSSKKGIANTYSNIGIIYKKKGAHADALKNYTKALELRNELKDQNGIRNSYSNIAGVHKTQENYKQAFEYYEKALVIAKAQSDKKGLATIYNNIGVLYRDQEDYQKAIVEYRKGLSIREEINDKKGIISSKINIGESYNAIDPRMGLKFINEGLDLAVKIKSVEQELYATMALAGNFNERKKYADAIKYFNKAKQLAKRLNAFRDQREIEDDVVKIYIELKDYKNAFFHHQVYFQLYDTLRKIENRESVARENIKLINETHDAQLNILNVKNDAIEKEKSQQQIIFGLSGLAAILVIGLIIRNNAMQRKSFKIIEQQKAEVEMQKNIAEKQKEVVEIKNEEILSSIQYAKRIQTAILPSQKKLDNIGLSNFVVYQPKDIVSGDFYWFERIGTKLYFTAADCTGHGVPGAMVSVVCSNALTKAVRELGLEKPHEILDKVSEIIEANFENADEDIADGMDLALCCLDLETKMLSFSGANNPLYMIRKGEEENSTLIENDYSLLELKADIQPIGKYFDRKPFVQSEVQMQSDDVIYSFSDGFADQFGGPKGKKYKYKPFKKLLLSISNTSMQEQSNLLIEDFNAWKGAEEQVDDVCIVGVRV